MDILKRVLLILVLLGVAASAITTVTHRRLAFRVSEWYVRNEGGTGNYIRHPDFDYSGDVTFQVKVKSDNWTDGTSRTFLSKWLSPAAWKFGIGMGNNLYVAATPDGASFPTSVAPTSLSVLTNGEAYTLRASWDVVNGSNRVCTFWYSDDDGATWNSLGTDTDAGNAGTRNTTSLVYLGADDTAFDEPFVGDFYSAKIFNADIDDGAESNLILHFEANDMTASGGADRVTGQNWSIVGDGSDPQTKLVQP